MKKLSIIGSILAKSKSSTHLFNRDKTNNSDIIATSIFSLGNCIVRSFLKSKHIINQHDNGYEMDRMSFCNNFFTEYYNSLSSGRIDFRFWLGSEFKKYLSIHEISYYSTDYSIDKSYLHNRLLAKYFNLTPVWTTDAFFGASNNSAEEYYSLNKYDFFSKRLNSELASKYSITMYVVSPEIIQIQWADYLFFLFKNRTRIDITFNKIVYLLFQVFARPPTT
ncbi:MAG: hypothetical protein J1F01_00765 [Oscillospiraceae bacterium]|nr:hypothetical protein [Oscillospiraceae bacterium]